MVNLTIAVIVIFKYCKSKELGQLLKIRNIQLHYCICSLFRRFRFTKFMLPEEIKNKSGYKFYSETIDISYVLNEDEEGAGLIDKLSRFNFERDDRLSLKFYYTDRLLKFISFCHFKQLKKLDLTGNKITDKALKYLIDCDFKLLQVLILCKTEIRDLGLSYLIKCDFKELQELDLSYNTITNKSVKYKKIGILKN